MKVKPGGRVLVGYKRVKQGTVLFLDIIALSFSFVIAVFLRFYLLIGYLGSVLISEIYTTAFLAIILIYILVFSLGRDNRIIYRKSKIENIILVLKNQIFLLVFFLLFLFALHKSDKISRAVIGFFFILNILLDSLIRINYSKYLCELINSSHKNIDVVLISTRTNRNFFLKNNNREIIDRNNEVGQLVIKKVVCIDEEEVDYTEYKDYNWLIDSKIDKCKLKELIDRLTEYKIGFFLTVDNGEGYYSYEMSRSVGNLLLINNTFLSEKINVLGINYTVSNLGEAVSFIKNNIADLKGKYICFSNAHTSVMSVEDKDYKDVQNDSAYTFADGYSVVVQQQRRGFIEAKRVAGPDFMDEMFNATMDGSIKHYFYGSTEETLNKLRENVEKKYPGVVIAGMYAPPFGDRSTDEDNEDIARINESDADMVWVALGAPKQERWMSKHKGKVNGLMLGVGAAFDFHAGTIKRAPEFIQKIGFEWLYRLFQDPKRLIKRYLITNIKFIWYVWRNK